MIIKKLFIALVAALAVMPAAQAQTTVAVVDIDSVKAVMPEVSLAQSLLEQTSQQYEDEYRKLTDEINKKIEEYQALSSSAAPAIRERRQQEIQDLDQRIQAFQQKAQDDLAAERRKQLGPIDEKINAAIAVVAQERGISLVQPRGQMLYVGPDVINITDDVVARLTAK